MLIFNMTIFSSCSLHYSQVLGTVRVLAYLQTESMYKNQAQTILYISNLQEI